MARTYFKLYTNDAMNVVLANPSPSCERVIYVQRMTKADFASGLTQILSVIGFAASDNARWGVINSSDQYVHSSLAPLELAQKVFTIGDYADHPEN